MKLKHVFTFTIILLCFTIHAQDDFQVITQLKKLNSFWGVNAFDNPVLSRKIKFDNDIDLIKLHLSLVEARLRETTPNLLTSAQKENRFYCLDVLNQYWKNVVSLLISIIRIELRILLTILVPLAL